MCNWVNTCNSNSFFVKVISVVCFVGLTACSTTSAGSYQRVDNRGTELSPPPGVIRYCWEEPIVAYERVNPGLNSEGTWYNPAHLAVKEVRMGRWKPCKDIRSKTYGRYDR